MSEDKAIKAIGWMRGAAPVPLRDLIAYVEEEREKAQAILASAKEDYLLRQNQGKVQQCDEFLKVLTHGEHS